jgi:ABC-type phosphate/phosphonate transport system substrate-binding protein
MALIASLPMYDLPEIKASTDVYWQRLAESFADHGLGHTLPQQLTRESDPHLDWLRPEMIFSQTCGLPYVRDLRRQVTLLGSAAYDIDCAPGSYFSVVIVREDDLSEDIADYASKRLAFNDRRSQSGFAAYFSLLNEQNIAGLPTEMIESGAHLRSIEMVAEGKADIAAIDAVTYALALRHRDSARRVKVIANTEVTPSLPYISSLAFANRKAEIVNAIIQTMAAFPETVRNDLLITGFNERVDADYDGIRTKWDKLVELGHYHL